MRNNFIKPYPNILAARIFSVFWLMLVLLQIVQVLSVIFKSEIRIPGQVFVGSTVLAWATLVTLVHLTSKDDISKLGWKKALITFGVILVGFATISIIFPLAVMNLAVIGVIGSWLANVVTIFIVFVKIYKTKSTQL